MKSNFVTRTIAVLAFLLVVVYFGASVLGYFLDPLVTAAAYQYRGEEGFTVSGYLIREEQVLDGVDSAMVYQPREEGERVSAGGQVAVVYHSQEALSAARQIAELELQLEQLEYAGGGLSDAQSVMRLDSSILESLHDLRWQVTRGELGDAAGSAETLRALVVRRAFAHAAGGAEELEGQTEALRQQINSLTATANSGRTFVTADRPGAYSALVDGYEEVLTPAMLEELTPSALDAVAADGGLTSNVGKLITSDTWYFAANLRESEAAALSAGGRVTIRFAGGLVQDLEMTVQSVSQPEGGRAAVVLRSDEYLSLTTLLRHQTAQLIVRTYEGIRVPKNAVRVVEEAGEGEDGTQEVSRRTAVYCRVGRLARQKPVTVLYEGEDYYLVEPDQETLSRYVESAQNIRTLRAGDEVVITAGELYDGKVLE